MRGVAVIVLLSMLLLLVSCSPTEEDSGYWDVSQFNKVQIIDFPYETLDATEIESIHELYKNENKALSLYRKTLDLFPGEQPFASIMLKQELQVSMFEDVYTKYELVFPEENWYDQVTSFRNPDQACAASLLFAEESVLMYEDWLSSKGFQTKVDNQDLRFLYEKLIDYYEFDIIPTLKRCGRGFY